MVETRRFMLEIIDQSFLDPSMKIIANDFIEYKENEGFRFAELVLFHYELFGGKDQEIHKIAAAMELIILVIDIFDDLVDQDNPNPPWMNIPYATAIHEALALLTAGHKLIDESSFDPMIKREAKEIFNEQVLRCIYGQQQDAMNVITNENDYLTVTKEKSGSLIAGACQLGTIFACKDHLQNVKEYAEHFGIAVQIFNDIQDVQRETSKNDFVNKKITLPILYLLKSSNPEFDSLKAYYEDELELVEIKAKQKKLIDLIKASGAIEFAMVYLQLEINHAKKIIREMTISNNWKDRIEAQLFR